MITSHMWTGWWEPNDIDPRPQYGPCETFINGVKCGKPRSEHGNPAPARPRVEPVPPKVYPYEDGDALVLGPECFKTENAICYQGEWYYS